MTSDQSASSDPAHAMLEAEMLSGGFNPPSFHSAAAILQHPRFAASRAAFIDDIVALYENHPVLSRLLLETGRSLVFFNLLTLNAAFVADDRSTWPTLGLLQRAVAPYQVTSERRVHDLVHRLVATGYVLSRPAPSDRRVRLLAPSEKMLEHHREWLRAFHKPLHVMFPEPGYGAAMDEDPVFQAGQLMIGRRFGAYSACFMAANPTMMFFMGKDAGSLVLFKLVQLTGQQDHADGPVASFTDLGRKFGVSRTHVRLLLKGAEQIGYLRVAGHRVALLPPIKIAFDRFLADCMAGNDVMFRLALRDDRVRAATRIG